MLLFWIVWILEGDFFNIFLFLNWIELLIIFLGGFGINCMMFFVVIDFLFLVFLISLIVFLCLIERLMLFSVWMIFVFVWKCVCSLLIFSIFVIGYLLSFGLSVFLRFFLRRLNLKMNIMIVIVGKVDIYYVVFI